MISSGQASDTTESEVDVKQLPGIFGGGRKRRESRKLGRQLEQLLGPNAMGGFQLPEFEGSPGFGAATDAQSQLLEQLTAEANQRTSVRGLGPASSGDIAQSIAPALVQFRQDEIGNQLQQREQDLTALLTGRGQDVANRKQTLLRLIDLIGLAAPQIVGGQKETGKGRESSIGLGF